MNPGETQAYNFAMSSFARMFGIKHAQNDDSIHKFCRYWAQSGEVAPSGSLTKVDFYFRDHWEIWGGHL